MKRKSQYNFLREQNIIVLISCRIIWGLTQALFMPYFSLFARAQEGVTPELLGIVISVRALGTAVLSPIAGHLADALGRKKIIFVGTALHSTSYLFYVIAKDVRMIFLGSLMEGLAVVHMPALQAITQDSIIPSQRGSGLAATTGLQALPSLISPFIGGILAERLGIDLGMRIGFALAFIMGWLVAFIRLKFLKETVVTNQYKAEDESVFKIVRKSYGEMFNLLREYKSLRGLILLSVVDTFFGAIASPFWIIYANEIVGLNTIELGLIEIVVAGVNVLVLLFSGRLIDRFKRKRIMLINIIIAPITNLAFIYSSNFSQMLLVRICLTIQNAFLMPASTALIADIIPRESRGKAIAAIGAQPIIIVIGAMSTGFFRFPPSFAGSILSGYVYSLNVRYPWFLLAGAYTLEFIICYLRINEPEKIAD